MEGPNVHAQGNILVVSQDPLWLDRLTEAASEIQCGVRLLRNLKGFSSPAPERRIPLTEPLEGPDFAFIRRLTEERPSLIVFDSRETLVPWERWISVVKTSAATRRNRILVYVTDPDPATIRRLEEIGADQVFDHQSFLGDLPDLLRSNLTAPIGEGLIEGCSGGLSAHASLGIQLHNNGSFYEAHEELEIAWMEADEGEGTLYRALLQITVIHLQLQRENVRGAKKMLLRVRQWLDPLPASCRGVDLNSIRSRLDALRQGLELAGEMALPAYFFSIPLLEADP